MPAPSSKKFWWVNQNQTFDHEFRGGYLWSPKTTSAGARNQFYENMRIVAPGDVVFSFKDTYIAAIGIAKSYGYESPKPSEFGNAGTNWSDIGWRVDVEYRTLEYAIQPKRHMHILAAFLPTKYSPLRENGYGNQGVYLAEVSQEFAVALGGLIGHDAQSAMSWEMDAPAMFTADSKGVEEWEDHVQKSIKENPAIPETEKVSLIKSRIGQGVFKDKVFQIESACRITKVDNPIHLIGSHIKPWRHCNNPERLDGENGLLLTPSIDRLFDRGFIAFEGNGDLLISPRADQISLKRMGVPMVSGFNVGAFTSQQRKFLEFHRESVFLQARKA